MIKQVTETLINEMTHLFVKTFNEAPWHDHWSFTTAQKRLLDLLHSPGFYGLAYYEDTELIGVILGQSQQYDTHMVFQIIELYIGPEHQRSGHGHTLLNRLLSDLQQQGIHSVFLLTLHGPSTEGFYQKNGFISQENMVMMEKKLSPYLPELL